MNSKPDAARQSMMANIETKTGRCVADWVRLVHAARLTKHGEIVAWLKSTHGFTHGYANMVALQAREGDAPPVPVAAVVDAWFAGDKAAIRPLYDAVLSAVSQLGGDIEFAPKKTYMSVRRAKQFACVHPSTKARLDLGLQLKGVPPAGRLEAAGS